MGNIKILTEDGKSGYEFFRLLSELVFLTPVDVYSTSYKDPSGVGGNMKILQAIKNLVEDEELTKADVLFIAVDNIIPTRDEEGEYVYRLRHILANSQKYLNGKGIKYYISKYVCWEELMLTFTELLEFCSQPDRDMNTPDIKQYLKIRGSYKTSPSSIDYPEIFKSKTAKRGITIEHCIAELLSKVTQGTTFHIGKNIVGPCWYTDCVKSSPTFKPAEKAFCQQCYAVKQAPIISSQQGAQRLKYVYRNSKFKDELAPLHIQLQSD